MFALQIPSWSISHVVLITRFVLLVAYFMLISCLAFSSTLKMEAICPSENRTLYNEELSRVEAG
jgi:hypothetical protein